MGKGGGGGGQMRHSEGYISFFVCLFVRLKKYLIKQKEVILPLCVCILGLA